MKGKVEESIKNDILPLVMDHGFEIEYVEFVKEGEGYVFRVVLDKPGALVSIDDCEMISRAIEDTVDGYIDKEYMLEVSSPGLERQLKNVDLYNKYIGNTIHIKLFKKQDSKKEFEGCLKAVDIKENTITLDVDNDIFNFNINDISSAHTVYDFKDTLSQNKDVNLNKLKKF